MSYYLGVDFGTTGVRSGIYDRNGNEAGYCSVRYETVNRHPGWAEQRPGDWKESLRSSVRGALEKTGIPKEEIVSMAADCHSCSVMLCRRDGTPLMDCMIWMDVRAAAESDEINAATGNELSPEWMPAKLLWLKRNRPELYGKAEVFCEMEDWINFLLTGKWSVNINNAVNWGYNADRGGFDRGFYEAIGMPEAVEKFPADNVYAVGDPIEKLLPSAAEELGLSPDTLLACGGIDSSIGILGMGVHEAGKLALVTGSSNLAMVLTEDPLFNKNGVNLGPHHLLHGFYTDYRGQTASGSVISWVKRELYRDLEDKDAYRIMDGEAAKIPVGSDGLFLLDYFQGNKHPYLDGSVRGMIYGLSLSHTRAHIFRAAMEGVCYETAHLLKQFADAGRPISEINLAGGFANSKLLLSILADVTGVPVNVPENPNCSCLGSGIVAAAAAGAWSSLEEASANMAKYRMTVRPDPVNHGKYTELFSLYLDTYPELKDYFRRCGEVFRRL